MKRLTSSRAATGSLREGRVVARFLGRPRRLRLPRGIPPRVLALSGLLLGTIGSCTLPSIKPPGL